MSRVVLSGYYGFHNIGDEAVLAATVEELRRQRPGLELTVLSAAPEQTSRAYGVRGVPRADPWAVVRALRECDLFLCGGGSLFQDATSWRSPWYYLGVLGLARWLARRTAVYAQGIDRPRSQVVRTAMARLLDGVDLITVRDRASQAVLSDLGVRRPPVAVVADPSLLLSPQWSAAAEAERRSWGEGPHFGLALRPWGSASAAWAAVDAARRLAERLGVRWVLLPMHGSQDLPLADRVAAELGSAAVVVRRALGPREMLALVGALDLVVAMRLHALLFAASQGVPVVALAYDPKVTALADELGGPPPLPVDNLESTDLVRAVEEALEDRESRRGRLLAAAASLRERALRGPALVLDLLP